MHGQLFDQGHLRNHLKGTLMRCSSPNQVKACCMLQLKLLAEQSCQDRQAGSSEMNMWIEYNTYMHVFVMLKIRFDNVFQISKQARVSSKVMKDDHHQIV